MTLSVRVKGASVLCVYNNGVFQRIFSIMEYVSKTLNTVLDVEKSKRLMIFARKRLFWKKWNSRMQMQPRLMK